MKEKADPGGSNDFHEEPEVRERIDHLRTNKSSNFWNMSSKQKVMRHEAGEVTDHGQIGEIV